MFDSCLVDPNVNGEQMTTFKSCAICKHCTIDLGATWWSEATPGDPGTFSCAKGHDGKLRDDRELLVACRILGSQCPDFELMDDPK